MHSLWKIFALYHNYDLAFRKRHLLLCDKGDLVTKSNSVQLLVTEIQ